MPDLLRDCMDDLGSKLKEKVGLNEFGSTFCARCRNSDCSRAGWSKDLFGSRVQYQEERLLSPTRSDPSHPKYAQLADFVDMTQEALKLEISSRRGDWTTPDDWAEVPVSDGVPERSSSGGIDEAVRALAKSQGRDLAPEPLFPEEEEEPMPLYEEELWAEPELVKTPPPVSKRKPRKVVKAADLPKGGMRNTPKQGGMMIDGSEAPTPKQAPDPWAVKPGAKKVPAGARIKFGKDGKIE